MPRKKRAKARAAKHVPIPWQLESYDADESDLEDSNEMPSPLSSSHPNYPLAELEKNLEESLICLKDLRSEGCLMPEDVIKINRIIKLFLRDMEIVICDTTTRYLPPSATCEYREPESESEPEYELIIPDSDSDDFDESSSVSDEDSEDLLQVKKGTYEAPTSRNSSGYCSRDPTSKTKLPSKKFSRDLPGKAFKSSSSPASNPESLREQTLSYKIRKKVEKILQEEPTAKELCSEFLSTLEIKRHLKNPRSGRTPGTQTRSFKHRKKKNKSF